MSKLPTDLKRRAAELRYRILQMCHKAQTPHLGSSLSCIDILVAAYLGGVLAVDPKKPDDPGRDRFVFSKGHAAMALYSTLAAAGFFPEKLLETFNEAGGQLPEQPSPRCVPGLEAATGSLGHGLPLGVGMAMAGRILDRPYRVVVLMSDGECNEGSVWEAAMFAPAQKLENLVAIVDFNKWQATGRSEEVMAMNPFAAKWTAFGWDAVEVDGHDIPALIAAMNVRIPGKPRAIIAHTVKGKGVSFMENDNNWHYRSPTAEEVVLAHRELGI